MDSALQMSEHIDFPTTYIRRCTIQHHCPPGNQHRSRRYGLHSLRVLEEYLREPMLAPTMGQVTGLVTGLVTEPRLEQPLEKVMVMQ